MAPDTVTRATGTPDQPQPYAELGLTGPEYQRVRRLLGRRPTDAELALYSVMWSEHCSYKSSKVHLRQFAEKAPPSDALLAGIGANAGVVDIGGGYAVTFKIESHNHPSYVEPHQGAATGVGGIVRDILAMGARPVAVMDALRFGRPAQATPAGCCPAWSAASPGTATAWACRTSAGSSASTPATRETRWSTRCASGSCGTVTSSSPPPMGRATRSSCSAPGPGPTASAARRCWPVRRSATAATRPSAPACRSATRSWRSC